MHLIIPTSLRQYTSGESTLQVDANDVGQALQKAFELHPALESSLIDDRGVIHSHVNLFVNDQNIRDLSGNATPLQTTDELLILGALAGG